MSASTTRTGSSVPRALAPGELADSFTRWQDALAEVGWNSLYLGNHDQPRPVSRFGDAERWWRESATALATVLHLQRGTPYVYQGEELGMTNAPFVSIDDYRDIESLNHHAEATARGDDPDAIIAGLLAMSRDHARTPVQWDASENAGFSRATPWIAVNPDHRERNAQEQYDDPSSVFAHYRALIGLRHRLPVVADGDFSRIDVGDPAVFAFSRQLGDDQMLVLVNLSSQAVPVDGEALRGWRDAELLLRNHGDATGVDEPLPPWQAKVYVR